MEEFSHDGYWWRPEDPSARLSGALTFAQRDGVRLSTTGSFVGLEGFGQFPKYPVLLGAIRNRLVTLAGCQVVGRGASFPGMLSTTFSVEYAVLGVHRPSEEELQADAFAFGFTHLGDWSGVFGMMMEFSEQNGKLLHYLQRYEIPNPVTTTVHDVRFSIESKMQTENKRRRRYSIEQRHRIKAETDSRRSPTNWIDEIVRPWQDLLSIATRVPNRVVELTAYYPDDPPSDDQGRRGFPIAHSGISFGTVPDSTVDSDEMLFSLDDLGISLSSVLERAFAIAEDSGSTRDLLFAVRPTERSIENEERFFLIARALEAYHREHRQVEEVSAEEHSRRVETAIASIPGDLPNEFRDWATGKLQYPYEPNLSNRIRDILREWSDLVRPLLPNRDRRDSFAFRVVNTRNCYAHGSEQSCANAVTGERLRFLTDVLSMLGTAYILRELSFEPTCSVELIQSKSWYQLLLQRSVQGREQSR